MNSLLEKSLNFNKKIKINFNGGNLTSDADVLLYKGFDEKIGFSKAIKKIFMSKIVLQMIELIKMKTS